ncbi:MAG: hypothetical protein COB98_00285 [Flavobacteriaceae bacterium]|nr:MAG: hypothetical protein COB98_00285 [Flavobacteriaceae bacterium]
MSSKKNIRNIIQTIITKYSFLTEQPKDSVIYLMGGHFMPVLDFDNNKVYPSINGLFPDALSPILTVNKMQRFSLESFEIVCEITQALQKKGCNVKICIIANDVTGLTEIRDHECNKDQKKLMNTYKDELLEDFYTTQKLPAPYLKILKKWKLCLNDIKTDTTIFPNKKKLTPIFCFKENAMHEKLRRLIRDNKDIFKEKIVYTYKDKNNPNKYEILLPCLTQTSIKYCSSASGGYTGGNRCSIEIVSFVLKLFGGNNFLESCEKVPENYKPATYKNNVLISFIPEGCDNAVSRGYKLYNKIFTPEKRNIHLIQVDLYGAPLQQLENIGFTI